MKVVMENAKLIGWEDKVSAKGNSYTVCLFAQGTDTLSLMLARNIEHDELVEDYRYNVYLETLKFDGKIEFRMVDLRFVDD